jgi:ABC-2 type transport system ATP-binding protein
MIRVAASPTAAPDAAAREVLRLEDVSMRFGDITALRDANLAVMGGTILGIIGPSGAGKTTMIRVLTGALKPTTGRARVLGQDPRHFTRGAREQIGYMPQQFTLYPDLTARENVDFVASLFGMLWVRRWRRTREVLEIVDLWDARKRRASDLSGGMQRRLELACALVHDPQLYFLDEPTAGIDPLLRGRIWEELHRLKDAGRTLLVTTQYINEAEECDHVALIAEGALIALAPPEELRRMASGGDIIEVETAAPFDPASLKSDLEIKGLERVGPTVFRAVVEDAGAALPDVVDAARSSGAEVVASREYRISFDEVFALLVDRHRRAQEAAAPGESVGDGDSSPPPPSRTADQTPGPAGAPSEPDEPSGAAPPIAAATESSVDDATAAREGLATVAGRRENDR